MSDTHTFLSTLFAGMTGTIELRPVPASPLLRDFVCIEGGFYEESKVDAYVAATTAQRINAFYGVATRAPAVRSGRLEDCIALPALFVDCDWKHTTEQAVLESIAEFPLAPSIVVSSGGGIHAYWLLDSPMLLSGPNGWWHGVETAPINGAIDTLRRLSAAIAAADESVSEPARVLRLPGTFNFKKEYGAPRPVTLDVCTDTRYTLAEMCEHIPAVAPPRPWKSGGVSLRPGEANTGAFLLPEMIAAGDRHSTLFALMRSQQIRGLSWEAAFAACSIENANRCECPIEERELETFLRRAWGTPNRGQA